MAAEIVGIDKINKYISKFDFQKIKLTRSAETLYIKRCKENETQAEEIIPLRKIYIIEFSKKCDCDGYTHIGCLQKWCNLYNKCPICRENIEKTI